MAKKFTGKMKVENLKELLQINMKKLISFLLIIVLISCSKDVEETINAFKSVKHKLDSGEYRKESLAGTE